MSLPNASEFYVIANTTGPAITSVRPTGKTRLIGNFANPPNTAALSPDGSRLVVGENIVHVFDTGTNTELTPDGIAVGGGIPVIGLVVSYDSQTAYALATYNGQSCLSAIDLTQLAVTNTLNITGTATGPALGPNGLLYVSVPNAIIEINPATLTATQGGTIDVTATPGKLVFTPDGNYALAANLVPTSQPAVLLISLAAHMVAGMVPATALPVDPSTGVQTYFDSLYVASNNLVYAFSSSVVAASVAGLVQPQTGTPYPAVYALQIGPYGGLTMNVPAIQGFDPSSVSALTFSNDLGAPGRNAPQYLFVVSNGIVDGLGLDNIYRIDPVSGLLVEQVPIFSMPAGVAYFAPTATPNAAVTVLTYGNNQAILPGTTALPLVIRALDQNGLPISGLAVNFALLPPAIGPAETSTVTPANTATGIDGYAEAIFSAGGTPADIGPQQIIATVSNGQQPLPFTINVATNLEGITATTLSVVSGQGQLVTNDLTGNVFPTVYPFVVLASDATGNPVANALITFTVTSGPGTLLAADGSQQQSIVVVADTTGQASATLTPAFPAAHSSYLSTVVNASTLGTSSGTSTGGGTQINALSQNFYITTMPVDVMYCGTPPCPPVTQLVSSVQKPAMGAVLQGTAGSTLAGAVQVYAGTVNGGPLPNVAVQVSTGADLTLPNASCANPAGGGVALTNASGVATCDVVLNGAPGTEPLTITVGSPSGFSWSNYTLTILPGAPANIKIVSGNQQNVPSGSILQTPLEIQLTDSHNNPVPGVPVSWTVSSGALRLLSPATSTNASGNAVAGGVVLSGGGTTVTVTVTAGSLNATFTILVSVPAATITIVSGNNQSALVNSQFPNPIVVQILDALGNPASYSTVNFVDSSATGSVGAPSVVADATGKAFTTVTAGGAPGDFTVLAVSGVGANAPQVKFTLAATLGPGGPTALNAASMAPGIAPGGLMTLIGAGLTPTIQGIVTDPTQMAGYSVTVDGVAAPVLALANQNGVEQINAQVPFETSPGTSTSITIQTPQGSVTITSVTVSLFAPGIFTNGTLAAPGGPYALATALRPDGSYVSASNPVQRGETITIFATGLGQTAPSTSTGVFGISGQTVANTLLATVNRQSAAVVSSAYQPGTLGDYALQLQVPATTIPGPAQPLTLLMLDSTGADYNSPDAFIPIQ